MNGKELRNGDLNQTVSLKEDKKGEQFNLSLHFSEVNTRHAGNFTCEAQNKYHKKERNIQVSITCKVTVFSAFLLSFLILEIYPRNFMLVTLLVEGFCSG